MASTTEGVDDPNRRQRGSQSRPEISYSDYRDRYRDMARTLEFEGHAAWAEGASALPKLTTAMIHAYPAHDEDAPEPHHH